MKTRKIPLRTCVVTGEKLDKRDLLRVVKNKDGEVKVDITGKMNGRGAYIKRDVKVLEEAIKKKSLERKLECNISNEVYDEIRKILE
ncbi:MAG TPA: YlxR family protein [Candidatus Onthousia faecipullorum]|uniref:YlxR family protein n=1 Tax=Candidatus Onthousia faecipullorum TaxID=2840887 RepID=A0A9D1KBP7_9FIRM|nr:YlxR family protein [Candidatus Onthousia faecipullorum]